MKKYIKIFKILLACAVMYYLFSSGKLDVQQIFYKFLNPNSFFITLLCCLSVILLNNYRWLLLLKSYSVNVHYIRTLKLDIMSQFFNLFSPGTIAGDCVRAYYISKKSKVGKAESLIIAIFDRFIGLVGILVLANISIIIYLVHMPNKGMYKNPVIIIVWLFTILFLLIIPILLTRRFRDIIVNTKRRLFLQYLVRMSDTLTSYKDKKGTLLKCVVLSILTQTLLLIVFVYLSRELNETRLSLIQYMIIVPLGMVAVAIPITPLGLGAAQTVYIGLYYTLTGHVSNIPANVITIIQMMQVCFRLFGGILWITSKELVQTHKETKCLSENKLF